jgi:DNA repair exonuclease SbcCD ATPase subunit
LDDIDKNLDEIEGLKNERYTLEADLIKIDLNSSIKTMSAALERLKDDIENKKKEKNPYLDLEEKRKKVIKELGAQIREINKQIGDLELQRSYSDFWIDGFKKIRMMIFDTMIDQLETLAQWYLSQYSSELSIVMTTERETRSGTIKDEFHIAIVDANDDEISYEMYSGGERQKIRLSISRALAQFIKESCGVDYNVIAFDEPNDTLDDVGKDTNFDTFRELSERDGKAVLVTDHDSIFKDKFDSNIVVIKENGESTICLI